MTRNEDIQEIDIDELPEDPWDEITLHLIHDSKIDQDFANANAQKCGRKKRKDRWMSIANEIPNLILQLQQQHLRERSLKLLSDFLLPKREEDPDNYHSTAYLLYNSCSTMTILLQEVLVIFRMMVDGSLTARASMRVVNVLTLFQCIPANKETRHKFVNSSVPNFLVPLILFECPLDVFENVRAVTLSVVGILCQARESNVIQWAVESNLVEVCHISIEIGNELSKVIGMHILEAILQDDSGISNICSPVCDHLLKELMRTWDHLVTLLAVDQDFSPRLLFHVIQCYFLLCNNVGGYRIITEGLPDPIISGSFHDIAEKFPVIGSLLRQLLLTVGRTNNCILASESINLQV